VARAGALLGLDRIMALVLGQGIFSDCDAPKVEGFSMEALWQHSVSTAAAAHRIAVAEQMDKDVVTSAFLAGMLHDIGKLVLAMGLPEQYAKVLKQATTGRPGELQQVEMLELRASHTDVGAYLVGLWGLPNTIAEAIAFHEDPDQASGEFGLPGIVHVADRIAHHPEIADPRHADLHLNFEYLEKHKRLGRWEDWRTLCAASIAESAKGKPS
jgi:HD-like signal output (HDOD) protein